MRFKTQGGQGLQVPQLISKNRGCIHLNFASSWDVTSLLRLRWPVMWALSPLDRGGAGIRPRSICLQNPRAPLTQPSRSFCRHHLSLAEFP